MAQVYYSGSKTKNENNIFMELDNFLKYAGIEDINFNQKETAVELHFIGKISDNITNSYTNNILKILEILGARPFITNYEKLSHRNGEKIIVQKLANTDIVVTITFINVYNKDFVNDKLIRINTEKSRETNKMLSLKAKPLINKDYCTSCKVCVKNCKYEAISIGKDKAADIDYSKCIGCGQCIKVCRFDAITEINQIDSISTPDKKTQFNIGVIISVSEILDSGQPDKLSYHLTEHITVASSDISALYKTCINIISDKNIIPKNSKSNSHSLNKENCTITENVAT